MHCHRNSIGYEDQFNLYAYVGNDPVNGVDPSGLDTTICDSTGSGECTTTETDENSIILNIDPDQGPPRVDKSQLLKFAIKSGEEEPQSGLLDDLKDAYCSLPSFGGGVSAGGYAGLGGGVTGEAAFDPSSGRISLSAGLNVGVGVGFSVAGTGNTGRGVSSAPVFGSVGVNSNVAAGPVRAGVAGTLIDSSGFNPRYNGANGGLRPGGGLTANANLTARVGTAFQILPSCK